jgi:site-specific DNA-methyltransferase (adenine-specific)
MRKKQIGSATLYLADAFEIMPTLGEVDSIITDPPYDARTHANARSLRGRQLVSTIDFDCFSEEQFIAFCRNAVTQAKRWVIMSCAWRHAAQLEQAGVPLVRFGIWHKPNGAPQFTGDRPGVGWEAIAILHREGRKHWNGGGHHAVWVCNVEHGEHPTQKPLKLLTDWVTKFTDEGETVLDPFMGSGTTGIACMKLGRKFIGIEKRADYFDLACRRIEAVHRQRNFLSPTDSQEQAP